MSNYNFQTNEDGQLYTWFVFDAWKEFCSEDLLDIEGFTPGGIEIFVGDNGGISDYGFEHDANGRLDYVGSISEFTSEKEAALDYFCENQEAVKNAVLNALLPMYQQWREDRDDDEITDDLLMPKITSIEQFSEILMPCAIYLHDTVKDGFAYIGFAFYATWEDEHALGFIVHKDRVLKSDPWISQCTILLRRLGVILENKSVSQQRVSFSETDKNDFRRKSPTVSCLMPHASRL